MTPIQEVLSVDDFRLLVDTLLAKHNSGNLGLLVVNDHEGMFTRYIISVASEDEVQKYLRALNKKVKNKVLNFNSVKKDD